jgi:protein gp37
MGAKTGTEWTDATWSPLSVKVRQELPFDRRSRDLIEPFVHEKTLMQPRHWRKPKKIFVENQSDLFGDWYTDEQVDRVFYMMALCPQHTFQIITRRPLRMLAYLSNSAAPFHWPLVNCWLGVSVENQATADARKQPIEALAKLGWVTFVSYEPALELVDWSGWEFLKWLIIGGESGTGARPFDVDWARQAIQWCRAFTVACFMKQVGLNPMVYMAHNQEWDWPFPVLGVVKCEDVDKHMNKIYLKDRKGGDMSEWPEDLRVREFPQ